MTLPACLAATGWDWLSLYACNADQVKLLLCKSRRKTRAMNTTQTTYGQNSPQLEQITSRNTQPQCLVQQLLPWLLRGVGGLGGVGSPGAF
jgi:hypothetical protein